MRTKWITTAVVALMAVLGFVAWRNSTRPAAEESTPSRSMPPGGDAASAEEPADPGIRWEAPAGWSSEGPRGTRLATYVVPAAGNAGPAECAVHYFGPGQGGTAEANIERWIGEFDSPKSPERSTRKVHGLRVSRARARGAYQSHGGAMRSEAGAAEAAGDHELLGAIVEGPNGPVFFKLTGPAPSVDRAVADFDRMIGSVRKK